MAAGESARAEVERVRKKIADLEQYASTFERGAIGEERTAEALGALGGDWVVFHDLRWPGRRLANIDHVAIGPGGIFVIDSKNWSGDVRVKDGVLRQNGYNREKSVAGVADAALALADLVGPYAGHVHPVLCFVEQPAMRHRAHEVLLCSVDNVVDLLRSFGSLWTPQQVVYVATRLDGQVITATQAGRGYAPGPRLWAARSRPRTRRPGDSRSAAGHAPQANSGHIGQGRRAAGIVVAALLAIVVGLPMLLAMGGLAIGVLAGVTSSPSECSSPAIVKEGAGVEAAKRPAAERAMDEQPRATHC